jgi:hypothetical protein
MNIKRSTVRSARRHTKGSSAASRASGRSEPLNTLLASLLDIENQPYFDLAPRVRSAIDRLRLASKPRIEAFSFVPHPDVLNALALSNGSKRYIVTIDTLRSVVYFKVREFLESFEANVSSYYSGGWSDYLCDVRFSPAAYEDFTKRLLNTLRDAGIAKWGKLSEAVGIFEVVDQLVARGMIASENRPDASLIQDILKHRTQFELCYRNYLSPAAAAACGGRQQLNSYLNALHRGKAILGFRIVMDFPFYRNRDYVPMMLSNRAKVMRNFLDASRDTALLLQPVDELLEVKPILCSDDDDKDVTHIFVNTYEHPGDRYLWKVAVYEAIKVDVNLYNYPLEGVLNQTPIYLSDVSETVVKAAAYEAGTGIPLGTLYDPSSVVRPTIYLPIEGLHRHGVTFGKLGTDKTNADLVVAGGASACLTTVLILEACGSIDGQRRALPRSVASRFTRHEFSNRLHWRQLLSNPGVRLIRSKANSFSRLILRACSAIQDLEDSSSDNASQAVHGLLLIEEASLVLGSKRVRRALRRLLEKACRKGWCVWLSVQRPTALALDETEVLDLLAMLGNRVILSLEDDKEIALLETAFWREGAAADGVHELLGHLRTAPEGVALLRGSSGDKLLAPILVTIPVFHATS